MAGTDWTPEQELAINAETGTLLVSAAAGSGKTSVLVERIVRKLTSPGSSVTPDSLLVVTFTKAAAEEMRTRILKRIAEKTSEDITRREEFSRLISRMGEMQISTMDAFSMKIVKENSHALGIDADFTMLETGEAAQMKKKAASEVIERRFSETPENFLPVSEIFSSSRNDRLLIESIIKLADFSMSEPFPDEWLDSVAENFRQSKAKDSVWGKIILSDIKSDIAFCTELLSAALSDISHEEELENKLGSVLSADINGIERVAEVLKTGSWDEIISSIEAARLVMKNRFTAPRAYTDNPYKISAAEKRNLTKKIIDKACVKTCCTEIENAEDVRVLSVIAKEFTDTVKEYNRHLLDMKKEAAAFDYPDILHFSLELLCDKTSPDGKTELSRELTERFSEILIDEYQDTNRAQDMIFTTISKNGENMFLVGDVKQSIYRFRLASPEIFIEKCEAYPYYDGVSKKSKIILGKNFRSRKGITDCVNFVFSSLMSKECGDIEYNEDEKLNFGAAYYPENSGTDAEFTVLEAEENQKSAVEAEYVAAKIKEMLTSGAEVYTRDGYRKAVPGDFCILLRSPSGVAGDYIRALRKRSVRVAPDSLESFFEAPEIRTMLCYLKVIDNPGRDTELLAVMLSPLFGFTPDDAAELRIKYGRKRSLFACALKARADGNEKCENLCSKISYYKKLSATYSADTLLREIYAQSSYPVIAGAMDEGEMRKNNLRILAEQAEKRNGESESDLSSFIRYMDVLRDNGAKIETGVSAGGGVRIMSMHKSKGLEFPFVFICGTYKKFNMQDINNNLVISHSLGLGIKRKEPENIKQYDTLSSCAVKTQLTAMTLSEELRIYYVALTRAKEKLFIVSAVKDGIKNFTDTQNILPEGKRIPAYLVKNVSNPFRWLLRAFINHPDGKVLRTVRPIYSEEKSRIDIKYIEEPVYNDISPEITENVLPDPAQVREIAEKASFSYKYSAVSGALAKHTASSLKEEHFNPVSFGKSVPAFMFASSMSPADIGTATHRFLQFCDFNKCKESAVSEKERLLSSGYIDKKQADAVDMDAISDFMHSDIMKRIDKSESCCREKQFTISKSICELDASVPTEFSEEKTVIIGKLDLLFIENGQAVIVDYKTDNIKDISVLASRYRQQMELYTEAVKKSMDIDVKECILYSLKLKKYISLSI